MLTVADIMTERLLAVSAAASVDDVAWTLAAQGAAFALVRDRWGRLVGTIDTADLADPRRRKGRRGTPVVSDVMSSRLVVVRADDPAVKAARLLARERLSHVVVVDALDQVVGVVTTMDVLQALVGEAGN